MASVLDLGDIFQLVIDGLQDRTVAQQQLVGQVHQPVLHIGFKMGNELHATFPQLFEQGLRQVPPYILL